MVDLRALVLSTAIICILSIVLGILLFPHLHATFLISLPISEVLEDGPPVVIRGQEFRISPWQKVLVCTLTPTRIDRLFEILVASGAAIVIIRTGHYSGESLQNGLGIFRVEAIIFAGWFALLWSFQWLKECFRLRSAGVAIAGSIGRGWGRSESVTYNFFDHDGNRRGGSSRIPDSKDEHPEDNAMVVFFSISDPDDNVSQHALRFHSLQVTLAPVKTDAISEVISENS